MRTDNMIWGNLKAFLLTWLTVSLVFPLFLIFNQRDTTYLWGVLMMLAGIVMPYMVLPALVAIAIFNWVVMQKRMIAHDVVASILLGGGVSAGVFLFTFLLLTEMKARQLTPILSQMAVAGGIFGAYYHWIVVRK